MRQITLMLLFVAGCGFSDRQALPLDGHVDHDPADASVAADSGATPNPTPTHDAGTTTPDAGAASSSDAAVVEPEADAAVPAEDAGVDAAAVDAGPAPPRYLCVDGYRNVAQLMQPCRKDDGFIGHYTAWTVGPELGWELRNHVADNLNWSALSYAGYAFNGSLRSYSFGERYSEICVYDYLAYTELTCIRVQ